MRLKNQLNGVVSNHTGFVPGATLVGKRRGIKDVGAKQYKISAIIMTSRSSIFFKV